MIPGAMRNLPFRIKMVLYGAVVSCLSLVLACIFLAVYDTYTYRQALAQAHQTEAEILADACGSALFFRDETFARKVLGGLSEDEDIELGVLFDDEGDVFAHYPAEQPLSLKTLPGQSQAFQQFEGDLLELAIPVHYDGELQGFLYLRARLLSVQERWLDYVRMASGVLGLSLVAALVLSHWLRRSITRPVQDLARTARQVAEDRDYSVRAPRAGSDELGVLIDAFNGMLDQIQESHTALRTSEQRLHLAVFGADMGMWDWQIPENMLYVNDRWAQMLGYARGETVGGEFWKEQIHSDDRQRVLRKVQEHLDGKSPFFEDEYRMHAQQGGEVWVLGRGKVVEWDGDGKPCRMTGTHLDITERKVAQRQRHELEEQLRQSQKMESIGRLAGGVAHDLNNLLAPIVGYTEMALKDDLVTGELRDDLKEVFGAGVRARDLIKQLLAFSRKQLLELRVLNLTDEVKLAESILRRLIAENIEIEFDLAEDAGSVRADPTQVHQILMNLASNANDAMPDGGRLVVSTRNVELEEHDCAGLADATPGRYVQLAVSDTGCGMDAETCERVFEPFFTTKEVERGTGLGLATVYGIVRQHKGHVTVHSEVGAGTEFAVYLPRVEVEPTSVEEEVEVVLQQSATAGVVMVVEDEEVVRGLACKMLRRHGFTVLEPRDVDDALRMAREREEPVDLLLTDVVMPKMNGRELYQAMVEDCPGLHVLFMSGYTENVITQQGLLDPGTDFLRKPFSVQELIQKISQLLA